MDNLVFNNINEFITWVEHQKRFSPKVSLDKMFYYCQLFANPQNKFKSNHITGTNGKGSTVCYLASIYQKAGYNVATYTSPYIQSFNERISYNSIPISDDDLLFYGNQILAKYSQISEDGYPQPTFFEFITLLAFLYFANIPNLDIAIIEVGMGGRLDATNVIKPIASVITNVSLEHMKILGPTIEAILNEKLGIVKDHIPLITTITDENLKKIIISKTNELQAPCYFIDPLSVNNKELTLTKTSFNFEQNKYELSMLGNHQIANALCAIKTIQVINAKEPDLLVSNNDLYQGLLKAKWIGRLEVITNNPLVIIDGGHNIDGITSICKFIQNFTFSYKRVVVSISADKELATMIKLLDQTFDEIIFTKYTYQRSAEASDLYSLSNCKHKQIMKINDSIDYVYNQHVPLTVFLGSLYLVSEVRPILMNKKNNM